MSTTTRYCSSGHRFDINGTMAVGETVTVHVTPAQGYHFVSWTDNGSTDPDRTIVIDQCGITYTARFAPDSPGPTPTPDKYTVTVTANPLNGGSVTGGGQYDDGASATIRATANSGYTFTNLTNGSQVITTNPEYTFTVVGDVSFIANFTSIAPTLSYRWVSSNSQNDLSSISNYASGTSSLINLGSNGLNKYNAFIIPSNASVSGSYIDSLGHTINMPFTQLGNPPVSVSSSEKYMYYSTGVTAPSGYSNAKFIITQ